MKFDIESLAPYLGATGTALMGLDENQTGADDLAGELLVYSAEVIGAVVNDEDLPAFPDNLRSGIADKISGAARASLIVANSVLAIARFQFGGKAAQILKYVNQALNNLLAGKPVPTPPTALLTL